VVEAAVLLHQQHDVLDILQGRLLADVLVAVGERLADVRGQGQGGERGAADGRAAEQPPPRERRWPGNDQKVMASRRVGNC
jgi:hypothetical protein